MSPESNETSGHLLKQLGMRVSLILALSMVGLFGYQYYVDHGPRPDVVVEGRVIDAATGSPLEGVFVQINIEQFSGSWHGGHMSCLYGEVIRTGADGRFQMRKPFRAMKSKDRRNGDTPSPRLGFYKSGWTTEKGNPWFLSSEGPDFRMVPDRKNFSERGLDISTMLDGACTHEVQGQGWPELWAAIFSEGVDQYCDETRALWSDISHASFYAAQYMVVGMLDRIVKQRDVTALGWPRTEIERRLASFRRWQALDRDLFFSNQRLDSDETNDPDVTIEAKHRFCSLLDAGTTPP